MENPFEKLTPEQIATRIAAAENRLEDMELEDITDGSVVPSDLPQSDIYGPLFDEELMYQSEDWEQ